MIIVSTALNFKSENNIIVIRKPLHADSDTLGLKQFSKEQKPPKLMRLKLERLKDLLLFLSNKCGKDGCVFCL